MIDALFSEACMQSQNQNHFFTDKCCLRAFGKVGLKHHSIPRLTVPMIRLFRLSITVYYLHFVFSCSFNLTLWFQLCVMIIRLPENNKKSSEIILQSKKQMEKKNTFFVDLEFLHIKKKIVSAPSFSNN